MMSSWAIVAIVAIAVWGVVQAMKAKNGRETGTAGDHQPDRQADQIAQSELKELRERIKVLERIATDANTTESRKIQEISQEIENLRDK